MPVAGLPKRRPGESMWELLSEYQTMVAYYFVYLTFRVLYGFHMVDAQYMPDDGPVILMPADSQALGAVLAQVVANIGLLMPFFNRGNTVSFMHEQLLVGALAKVPIRGHSYGLRPHASGTLALSLIDGYRQLLHGGAVSIAAEGDICWDGKTISVRDGCAWLGLHTAAPILPLIPTAGCYDIWPFWQRLPRLSGRMDLVVGKPFKVTDTPLTSISEERLAEARSVIQEQVDLLRYGPEGVAGWQGQALLRGEPVDPKTLRLRLREPAKDWQASTKGKPYERVSMLLFQCPICGADGSIRHKRRVFGHDAVVCQACGSRWSVKRTPGKDFRVKLVAGPEELLGLEMALSQWYDAVKETFRANPPQEMAAAVEGKVPLLEADEVQLIAHEAAAAASVANGARAATEHQGSNIALPDHNLVGKGTLVMTDHELVWQNSGQSVAFDWANIRALHLTFRDVFTISNGAAWYSFRLGDGSAIRWAAYADRALRGVAQAGRRKATVSPY